jgi:glycine cleavage system H lipoate-binding protein
MPCPFLKEGRARYCHAAPVRKLILEGPGTASEGRCASPEFRTCELVRGEEAGAARCPHLEEIHVQYCAASPITKLVPFSESQLSRCSSGYRYCDSYLSVARPGGSRTPAGPNLLFSPNHFWLEAEESNLCHIGVDGFLAGLTGRLDRITFITTRGTHRPSVALTVNGVEWPMVFPNPILIERVNTHLRSDAKRLADDPYGVGWLFEGWELPGKTRTGLIGGAQATAWQAEERERLAHEIHETQGLTCDGGYAQPGVARLLPRENVVGLLQRFFSRTDWSSEE